MTASAEKIQVKQDMHSCFANKSGKVCDYRRNGNMQIKDLQSICFSSGRMGSKKKNMDPVYLCHLNFLCHPLERQKPCWIYYN